VCTAEAAPVSDSEVESFFHDLERVPTLVLAVSGGPDSTALMVAAARWRERLKSGPKLVAVTVDHGLRAESAREAAAVGRLARQLGLAHRTLRWTGKKPSTGLQEAARAARYRLLAKAAREAGAAHILTAHTLDDQAETVLIRLTRGSGLTGLGGMQKISVIPGREPTGPREARPDGKLREPYPEALRRMDSGSGPSGRPGMTEYGARLYLLRPLLDVPKARLIATLRAAKIPFADDPSNRDPRFTRARLRALMPALTEEGLDARRLAVLARRLRRADAAIEAAVDRAMADLALACPLPAAAAFDAKGYAVLPAEVALRLLGRAITAVGDEGPVELAKLEGLKDAVDCAQNTHMSRFRRSLAGAVVTLTGGTLMVERAAPRRRKALTNPRRGKARAGKTR
jgi:tRNA(Ile)-lysidine synthase